MAIEMRRLIGDRLGELRFDRTAKRLRAFTGDTLLFDSTAAILVWEPRRVVPSYAVPVGDVAVVIAASERPAPEPDDRPIWDPRTPFAMRLTPGRAVELAGGVAGFLPDELDDMLIVDFDGPDRWLEEDQRVFAHPRDPYHRIDVLDSARRLEIRHDGELLARSHRARTLFETGMPPRHYLPFEDVIVPLRPSATRTRCAYKGEASYYSAILTGGILSDIAWSYREPADDGRPVAGLFAFWDERLDLTVDGEPVERATTLWS